MASKSSLPSIGNLLQSKSEYKDFMAVMKGIQMVVSSSVNHQCLKTHEEWHKSTLKQATTNFSKCSSSLANDIQNPEKLAQNLQHNFKETVDRASMVFYGIKELNNQYRNQSTQYNQLKNSSIVNTDSDYDFKVEKDTAASSTVNYTVAHSFPVNTDANFSIKSELKPHELPNIIRPEKPLGSTNISSPQLSPLKSQPRKVPASRLGRFVTFGGLFAGLGLGAVSEVAKRSVGLSENTSKTNLLLTEANAKRIADTLSKVRGAALKLGQLLSILDDDVINPQLQAVLERVRQNADFMPTSQLYKVLKRELGPNWQDNFKEFNDIPFAAASIGQVHRAVTLDGKEVAMKIQYPGVAAGIDSDIKNLVSIMNIGGLIPEGLYLDSVVRVAKRELGWECDYIREAECTRRFKAYVEPYADYYIVPEVEESLCTKQIFSSQLVKGIPVDKCVNMDQSTRNYICWLLMRLTLLELFSFRYMQTDPNWSNFFYNPEERKLVLLDFGACRDFDPKFLDSYLRIIKAAADGDREAVSNILNLGP